MYKNIYDLSYDQLLALVDDWNESAYRANQIWEGLYRHFWSSPEDFTILPKTIRQKLGGTFGGPTKETDKPIDLASLQNIGVYESKDGNTKKTLFSLSDGNQVEAVIMRYAKRNTLCISTQAGCAMGCVFCATGQMGFKRQLTSGEIVQQVLHYSRQLAIEREQVTNIVMMGMGEPFHNYDAAMTAIKRLNDPQGMNLGARRFTISTVGLIPGIRRFTNERSQINLAISLHAADDNLRSKLLPINKKYPLNELFSACLEYVHETHRRISFEWALIQNVNDTQEQAHLLVKRLAPFHFGGSVMSHVNIILLNPTPKYGGQASTPRNALDFRKTLEQACIPCTIRLRRGIDIQAGCGQLASHNVN